MEHGELTNDGSGRWCKNCGHEHGFLYACKYYPAELLNKILLDSQEFTYLCKSGNVMITKDGVTKSFNDWNKDGD